MHESNKVFRDIYKEFKDLPVEDIAIRKNVKEYEKYAKLATNYSMGKGTPIHVKSSIYYNQILRDYLYLNYVFLFYLYYQVYY